MRLLLFLMVAFTSAGLAWLVLQAPPQDLPWEPLDLDQPVGLATAYKLRALADDPGRCRQLLRNAGVVLAPPQRMLASQPECLVRDGLRVRQLPVALAPAGITMSCPMAAALTIWSREVVRPAARRHLGRSARTLHNLGSWNCRTIAGSANLSEHASANAIDISAVTLAGDRRVSVERDWDRQPARAAFLRDIRNGACQLFSVVLSPDHDADHADHLHLDLGSARACE